MRRFSQFAAACFILSAPVSQADENPTAAEDAPVSEWVRQLDADEFAVRESAARKLEKAGAAAVLPLVETATAGGAEARRRALAILRIIGEKPDEETIAALDKIAESGSPEASDVAKSVLKFARLGKNGEIPVDEFVIPGVTIERAGDTVTMILPGGGRIQSRVAGGRGTNRSMIRTGGNTFIFGSSDGKQAIIAVGPGGDVKMKVTADDDGKPFTRAYQFRTRDELRRLNPDLADLFDRLEQGGGIRGLRRGIPRP